MSMTLVAPVSSSTGEYRRTVGRLASIFPRPSAAFIDHPGEVAGAAQLRLVGFDVERALRLLTAPSRPQLLGQDSWVVARTLVEQAQARLLEVEPVLRAASEASGAHASSALALLGSVGSLLRVPAGVAPDGSIAAAIEPLTEALAHARMASATLVGEP